MPKINQKIIRLILAALLVASFTSISLAQDFKPYPGSKHDDTASREASKAAPNKQSEVYTTNDSFEKVYAYYSGLYKETKLRSTPPKAPSGQQIKWAFFIVDGGTSMLNSKLWFKIQSPYIGGADGSDVRDLTVIQLVRSK